MPVTTLLTPLVTPRPTPVSVRTSDTPAVTGARARPTMDKTPPAIPTELPATVDILAPIFILSSWTALSSRFDRNCSILEQRWLNTPMKRWACSWKIKVSLVFWSILDNNRKDNSLQSPLTMHLRVKKTADRQGRTKVGDCLGPPKAKAPLKCFSYTRCNLSTDTRTVAVYMFSTTTTVCMSELNVLLVYPACSKLNYYASEDSDSRESTRSLYPSAHTSLSLCLLCSASGWKELRFVLSVNVASLI